MNVNNLTYAGRLVADPELRFTPSNVAVCDIRVATNDRIKDKATGQWRDGDPTFLDVTLWSGSAEAVSKYFHKGEEIYLEGRLVQESWEDRQTGAKRSKIKMVASRWQFVGSKDSRQQPTTHAPQTSQGYAGAGQGAGTHEPVGEEDIPF
jgi:single-strand DNA-binding protein